MVAILGLQQPNPTQSFARAVQRQDVHPTSHRGENNGELSRSNGGVNHNSALICKRAAKRNTVERNQGH